MIRNACLLIVMLAATVGVARGDPPNNWPAQFDITFVDAGEWSDDYQFNWADDPEHEDGGFWTSGDVGQVYIDGTGAFNPDVGEGITWAGVFGIGSYEIDPESISGTGQFSGASTSVSVPEPGMVLGAISFFFSAASHVVATAAPSLVSLLGAGLLLTLLAVLVYQLRNRVVRVAASDRPKGTVGRRVREATRRRRVAWIRK